MFGRQSSASWLSDALKALQLDICNCLADRHYPGPCNYFLAESWRILHASSGSSPLSFEADLGRNTEPSVLSEQISDFFSVVEDSKTTRPRVNFAY